MEKIQIVVPAAGESVTEADIAAWMKESGDYVEVDEELVELETDKASMPLLAQAAGILHITIEDGTVQVGDVLGYVEVTDAKPVSEKNDAPANSNAATPTSEPVKTANYASGHPSPAAAKELAEKNIDPASVQGSGKNGRITKEDAQSAKAQTAAPSKASENTAKSTPEIKVPETRVTGSREVRHEKMSRMRRTIASRLVEAQQEAALLTTFNEVDMHAVMELRKQFKDEFKEKHNVGLGFMSFFTKAASIALQEQPIINAQVQGENIVYHDFCDIGIAVSTPKGLVVPVVRNTESMSFSQIESSILGYAFKGRDGKLTPDDMTGGTFTITNGGVFGSMLSTPIVNRPQSAIMGMHNIVQRPVAINGEVKIRPIMYLALTYDHRIIDGAQAVSFLVKVKKLIEEPARLMLDL